ncbi:type IV pilus assembly protein PilE [bacterium A37T11]|nr:type IV pilus assembly protein PilE [bacterium A37T11]
MDTNRYLDRLFYLVIIGIPVLLVISNLMHLITRAKTTEAKLQIQHVHTLEKYFFYLQSIYSDDLEQLVYEHERLYTEGG